MTLSIIIPVHNTPKEIFSNCIMSIVKQKYQDFEVIVVDDGSIPDFHDQYKEICADFSKIRFKAKKQGGVSSARNFGMLEAKGKYITFVDSDDTVTENAFEIGVSLAEKYNADFVIGKVQYIKDNVEYCDNQGNDVTTFVAQDNISDVYIAMYGGAQKTFKYLIKNGPYAKVFKTSIIRDNDIKFNTKLSYSEDAVFNREYCRHITNAIFSNEIWYNYYQYDFSAMHKLIKENFIQCNIDFWNIWSNLNKTEPNKALKNFLVTRVVTSDFFDVVRFGIVPLHENYKIKIQRIRNLYKEDIMIEAFKEIDLKKITDRKQWIRAMLFKRKFVRLIWLSQLGRTMLSKIKKRICAYFLLL